MYSLKKGYLIGSHSQRAVRETEPIKNRKQHPFSSIRMILKSITPESKMRLLENINSSTMLPKEVLLYVKRCCHSFIL